MQDAGNITCHAIGPFQMMQSAGDDVAPRDRPGLEKTAEKAEEMLANDYHKDNVRPFVPYLVLFAGRETLLENVIAFLSINTFLPLAFPHGDFPPPSSPLCKGRGVSVEKRGCAGYSLESIAVRPPVPKSMSVGTQSTG